MKRSVSYGDGAMIKAGGIDLLDLMKEDIVSPPKLVNIRNIDSLRGITPARMACTSVPCPP